MRNPFLACHEACSLPRNDSLRSDTTIRGGPFQDEVAATEVMWEHAAANCSEA
jgi:hypothetical protein